MLPKAHWDFTQTNVTKSRRGRDSIRSSHSHIAKVSQEKEKSLGKGLDIVRICVIQANVLILVVVVYKRIVEKLKRSQKQNIPHERDMCT